MADINSKITFQFRDQDVTGYLDPESIVNDSKLHIIKFKLCNEYGKPELHVYACNRMLEIAYCGSLFRNKGLLVDHKDSLLLNDVDRRSYVSIKSKVIKTLKNMGKLYVTEKKYDLSDKKHVSPGANSGSLNSLLKNLYECGKEIVIKEGTQFILQSYECDCQVRYDVIAKTNLTVGDVMAHFYTRLQYEDDPEKFGDKCISSMTIIKTMFDDYVVTINMDS